MHIHHVHNWPVIQVTVSRAYVLCRHNALFLCLVGSIWPNVTSPMYLIFGTLVLNWPLLSLVRIDLDNDVFKIKVLDVWHVADGDEYNICLKLMKNRLCLR